MPPSSAAFTPKDEDRAPHQGAKGETTEQAPSPGAPRPPTAGEVAAFETQLEADRLYFARGLLRVVSLTTVDGSTCLEGSRRTTRTSRSRSTPSTMAAAPDVATRLARVWQEANGGEGLDRSRVGDARRHPARRRAQAEGRRMLAVGSICAGIGGWDLGLERAGMVTRWQVEIDPWCRRVLAKHFPDATRYEDAHAVDYAEVEDVDVIAAGYPCQPFSVAGRRAGFDDPRNVWPAVAREPFATFDRASSAGKRRRATLRPASATFSETWPRSGIVSNGMSYPRPPSAPRTSAREVWLVGARERCRRRRRRAGTNQSPSPGAAVRPSLQAMARSGLLPTPVAQDAKNNTLRRVDRETASSARCSAGWFRRRRSIQCRCEVSSPGVGWRAD